VGSARRRASVSRPDRGSGRCLSPRADRPPRRSRDPGLAARALPRAGTQRAADRAARIGSCPTWPGRGDPGAARAGRAAAHEPALSRPRARVARAPARAASPRGARSGDRDRGGDRSP
jgi:hypothetical protein